MGLFTKNKKIKKEETKEVVEVPKVSTPVTPVTKKVESKKSVTKKVSSVSQQMTNTDLASVLRRPRITEKASFQAENGVYVFDISPRATKKTVADAVHRFYKVTPVKINITKIPAKKFVSRMRRQWGVKTGGKKAYVYLKKGDKIEIV